MCSQRLSTKLYMSFFTQAKQIVEKCKTKMVVLYQKVFVLHNFDVQLPVCAKLTITSKGSYIINGASPKIVCTLVFVFGVEEYPSQIVFHHKSSVIIVSIQFQIFIEEVQLR